MNRCRCSSPTGFSKNQAHFPASCRTKAVTLSALFTLRLPAFRSRGLLVRARENSVHGGKTTTTSEGLNSSRKCRISASKSQELTSAQTIGLNFGSTSTESSLKSSKARRTLDLRTAFETLRVPANSSTKNSSGMLYYSLRCGSRPLCANDRPVAANACLEPVGDPPSG